jgi:hypothetical protein
MRDGTGLRKQRRFQFDQLNQIIANVAMRGLVRDEATERDACLRALMGHYGETITAVKTQHLVFTGKFNCLNQRGKDLFTVRLLNQSMTGARGSTVG